MANFRIGDTTRTHGLSKTPEYKIWEAMKRRCDNSKDSGFARYGGRGIGYCEAWKRFEAFIADMGKRPSKTATLERVDNEADYGPNNCEWATRTQQANNRRSNHRLFHDGECLTLAQWSRRTGFPQRLLSRRIQRGWEAGRALTQPIRETQRRLIAKGLMPK